MRGEGRRWWWWGIPNIWLLFSLRLSPTWSNNQAVTWPWMCSLLHLQRQIFQTFDVRKTTKKKKTNIRPHILENTLIDPSCIYQQHFWNNAAADQARTPQVLQQRQAGSHLTTDLSSVGTPPPLTYWNTFITPAWAMVGRLKKNHTIHINICK